VLHLRMPSKTIVSLQIIARNRSCVKAFLHFSFSQFTQYEFLPS